MQKAIVVLGVDPGTRVAGFSVVKIEQSPAAQYGYGGARCPVLLDYGVLTMKGELPLSQRVGMFHRFFTEKITTHGVSRIALETPFFGKNHQTFLKLGYMRGILYLLQDMHQLELFEFSPSVVKQSITGYGGAEKEQVARVVLRFFPALTMPKKLDVTDAIAVSLCGAWSTSVPQVSK